MNEEDHSIAFSIMIIEYICLIECNKEMNTNLNASHHYRCVFVLNSDTKLTFLFSLIALIHSSRFLGQSNMMQMYVHVCGQYELGQPDPLLLLDRYMHSFL
jgi:hypothetical protein